MVQQADPARGVNPTGPDFEDRPVRAKMSKESGRNRRARVPKSPKSAAPITLAITVVGRPAGSNHLRPQDQDIKKGYLFANFGFNSKNHLFLERSC